MEKIWRFRVDRENYRMSDKQTRSDSFA